MTAEYELSNLIDHYIIVEKMNYAEAHAKAWKIVEEKREAQRTKMLDDLISRYVII